MALPRHRDDDEVAGRAASALSAPVTGGPLGSQLGRGSGPPAPRRGEPEDHGQPGRGEPPGEPTALLPGAAEDGDGQTGHVREGVGEGLGGRGGGAAVMGRSSHPAPQGALPAAWPVTPSIEGWDDIPRVSASNRQESPP